MPGFDVVCFSHLRWDFVHQRPQHLMTRAARGRRVLFVQPAVADGGPRMEVERHDGVVVATPRVPSAGASVEVVRSLIAELVERERIRRYVVWHYHLAGHALAAELAPLASVYDCMDQAGSFADAEPDEIERERALIADVDVVFTGGRSLYEAKRRLHPDVHAFPSSVDRGHFARARAGLPEPADQAAIARPRAGWFGVIEERVDLPLLARLADARPDLQVVMVGPVVRIDAGTLPRRPNLHFLGLRPYADLPAYLAGWDVAIMPFALNRATEYISPTKTLEYLAGGRPVVSTAVRDVVRPYGAEGLVAIGHDHDEFVARVADVLEGRAGLPQERVDALLDATSWDATWEAMEALVERAIARRAERFPGAGAGKEPVVDDYLQWHAGLRFDRGTRRFRPFVESNETSDRRYGGEEFADRADAAVAASDLLTRLRAGEAVELVDADALGADADHEPLAE